jgi:hypothetical protein
MFRWGRTPSLLAALLPLLALAEPAPAPGKPRRASQFPPTTGFQLFPPRARSPMAPRIGRVLPLPPAAPQAAGDAESSAPSRARACKFLDLDADGVAGAGEPKVVGWRFRLRGAPLGTRIRATGTDGCATFEGLQPGSYVLNELLPPASDVHPGAPQGLDVAAPGVQIEAAVPPASSRDRCVQYARMGSLEYWRGRSGLRLLDDSDRAFVNALEPFRSPSATFAAGDEPFDGRFSDGVTPVRGALAGRRAWGPGTWEAEVSHFLGDRAVSADPRGRLAQEVLAFTLNARHFLERAQVVYLEDVPILVDELISDAIVSWRSDSPARIHDTTALLALLNGARELPYVPREQCRVAYVPF